MAREIEWARQSTQATARGTPGRSTPLKIDVLEDSESSTAVEAAAARSAARQGVVELVKGQRKRIQQALWADR